MLSIEYADIKGMEASKPKAIVVSTAGKLSTKGTIAMVKQHEELILKVQTDEFWETADIFEYEIVRKVLRDFIKFLEKESRIDIYTDFTDEIIEVKENAGEFTVNDLKSYRKKVNQYLHEQRDDIVVYKLRNNKAISTDDIKHLEKILWQDLGTKDDYINEYGEEPLLKLTSKIVGLDPTVANEAFSEFLSDEALNSNQMEFVKLIVDFIIANGTIEKSVLNEQPFNKFGNVISLFEDKIEIARSIIRNIDELNSRIDIS